MGEEQFDGVKFQIDYNLAQQHFDNRMTDEELVNAVFAPQEQVSQAQIDLLGAAFMLATAGPAQPSPASAQALAAHTPTSLGTGKRIPEGGGNK